MGTWETDRVPIFGVKGRTSGEVRYFVRHHADQATCRDVIESTTPVGAKLYTDGLSGYVAVGQGHCSVHGRVFHSHFEWARDDDGDGVREVHCNGCEGMGAGLRTFLRAFRGVNKNFLWDYVAVYEATFNSKRITPSLVQCLCFGFRGAQINYT
jgi:transposase-like protein